MSNVLGQRIERINGINYTVISGTVFQNDYEVFIHKGVFFQIIQNGEIVDISDDDAWMLAAFDCVGLANKAGA